MTKGVSLQCLKALAPCLENHLSDSLLPLAKPKNRFVTSERLFHVNLP